MKPVKKILLLAVAITMNGLCIPALAQKPVAELYSKINVETNDSMKLKRLVNYTYTMFQENKIPQAIDSLHKLEPLLNFKQHPILIPSVNFCIGACFFQLKIIDSAFVRLKYAYKYKQFFSVKSSVGLLLYSGITGELGNCYEMIGKNDSASIYYFQALDEAVKSGNTVIIAQAYKSISDLFMESGEKEKALENIIRAKNYQQSNYKKGKYLHDQVASEVFSDLSICYSDMDLLDEAKLYADSSRYFAGLADDTLLARSDYIGAYGRYYLQKNNIDTAIAYFTEHLRIVKKLQEPFIIAYSHRQLGILYAKKKNYEAARLHLEASIALSQKHTFKNIYVHKTYADVLLGLHQYKKAFQEISLYQQLQDSFSSTRYNYSLEKLTADYQFKEQQDSIITLKKINGLIVNRSKGRYAILGILLLASIIISYLLYVRYKNKKAILEQAQQIQSKQIHQLEQDKELLVTQGMLEAQELERNRIGQDLHDGICGELSSVKMQFSMLESKFQAFVQERTLFIDTLRQLDNSINEIRNISHNLMPENVIRFGLSNAIKSYCSNISSIDKLTVNYNDNGFKLPSLSAQKQVMVYRIMQELMQNVIKHAQASKCFVQLSDNNQYISLTVEDNGKGFERKTGHRSIRNRVEYVKGIFEINSTLGKGTFAMIQIPV
jgi:two-component system, NarL family, sensor kinase